MSSSYKYLLCIPTAVCFQLATVQAQYVTDYKKNADKYYAKGDYLSAAEYYQKYLDGKKNGKTTTYEPYSVQGKGTKKDKDKTSYEEIVYRIAESYRNLNDYGKAEPKYAEASKFNQETFPLAKYWYATALRANGKYEEAKTEFKGFIATHKDNDNYKQQAQRELLNLDFIQQELNKKDISLYNVAKQGGSLTSVGSNYAAAYNKTDLVFTSSRADSAISDKKTSPYINNLYHTNGTTVEKLGINSAVGQEQGIAAFCPDGNRIFFTRWATKDVKKVASIYTSEKNSSGVWSEPTKLGSSVNVEGSSSQQPFVTADGKYLLFASDRSGGMGKLDLWYAPLDANEIPGNATNMGAGINTNENDEAPFYHQASSTLVFATDGRVGMGGLDLFASKGTMGNLWQQPKNLGYPVNSIKDDNYFTNAGKSQLLKDAYVSSDRSSECCLELFSVNKTYKKYIAGTVTDCKTGAVIDAANVTINDSLNNKTLSQQLSTNNGGYLFELSDFAPLELVANKSDYYTGKLHFYLPTNSDDDTLKNATVCLIPIEKVIDSIPVVKKDETEPAKEEVNAYFDFAKYNLRKETAVFLDSLAALLKRENKLGLEITGYTDNLGTPENNLKLSKERADACKNYIVNKGIAASRLKTIGKGECCPVQPDTLPNGQDNPAGRQANRRVEIKILYLGM